MLPPSMWKEEARKHWAEHRPKMFKQMQEAGTLEQRLDEAVEETERELYDLLCGQGVPLNSAWEMVRENHLLLPTEEDVPALGETQEAND